MGLSIFFDNNNNIADPQDLGKEGVFRGLPPLVQAGLELALVYADDKDAGIGVAAPVIMLGM